MPVTGGFNEVSRSLSGRSWLPYKDPSPDPGGGSFNSWGGSSIIWDPDNGLFIVSQANAANGDIYTSPDGKTWTGRFTGLNDFTIAGWRPQSGPSRPLARGNGHTLASSSVSPGSISEVAISTDDVHWTWHNMGVFLNVYGITWDVTNSQWVAVGADTVVPGPGSHNVATSPDGITWTQRGSFPSAAVGSAPYLSSVAEHGGHLSAGSYDPTNPAWVSTDGGHTWASVTMPSTVNLANIFRIRYLNGRFVAVGSQVPSGTVGLVMTSSDGFTWIDQAGTSILVDSLRDIAWASSLGLWIAVGRNFDHGTGFPLAYRRVFISPDLHTWTPIALIAPGGSTPDVGFNGQSAFLNGIAWSPAGAMVACGIEFWFGTISPTANIEPPLRQRQRNDGLTLGASRVRSGLNVPTSAQLGRRVRGPNGYL
jgi:hypothetical protein